MRIKVGPARRPGNTTIIYDESLAGTDIAPDGNGTVQLSFDAHGVRCDKSLYRYQMRLSREDIAKIIDAAKYAGMAGGAMLCSVAEQYNGVVVGLA
jgi:hypothetical protein